MVNDSGESNWMLEFEQGDVGAIKRRVLADPEFLRQRSAHGATPLLAAIEYNDVDLVQFLLQHGADPNVTVDDGYTCLLTAIESDALESLTIVAALIDAGADLHVPGIGGSAPLHMAAARGLVDKARLLIEAGAEIDQRKEIDAAETPLMEAAFTGQPKIVQLLLDRGADPTLRDTMHQRTPLEIAQSAAAGPDPDVYNFLKEENIQINPAEVLAELDLPPEQLAEMEEGMRAFDMAENYLENSQRLVDVGEHAEVIRILNAASRS